MKSISAEWKANFGLVPPLGYLCREAFPDRWIRIHSLPESKRYPESEAEMAEVCRRHNEIATNVFGLNGECILVIGRYAYPPGVVDVFAYADIPPSLKLDPSMPSWIDDESRGEFYVRRTTWAPGKFDRLLRDVADEEEVNVLFFSPTRSSIYSPYDGGADLILPNADMVTAAKEKWSSWLSALDSGL